MLTSCFHCFRKYFFKYEIWFFEVAFIVWKFIKAIFSHIGQKVMKTLTYLDKRSKTDEPGTAQQIWMTDCDDFDLFISLDPFNASVELLRGSTDDEDNEVPPLLLEDDKLQKNKESFDELLQTFMQSIAQQQKLLQEGDVELKSEEYDLPLVPISHQNSSFIFPVTYEHFLDAPDCALEHSPLSLPLSPPISLDTGPLNTPPIRKSPDLSISNDNPSTIPLEIQSKNITTNENLPVLTQSDSKKSTSDAANKNLNTCSSDTDIRTSLANQKLNTEESGSCNPRSTSSPPENVDSINSKPSFLPDDEFLEADRFVGDKGKRPSNPKFAYKKRSKIQNQPNENVDQIHLHDLNNVQELSHSGTDSSKNLNQSESLQPKVAAAPCLKGSFSEGNILKHCKKRIRRLNTFPVYESRNQKKRKFRKLQSSISYCSIDSFVSTIENSNNVCKQLIPSESTLDNSVEPSNNNTFPSIKTEEISPSNVLKESFVDKCNNKIFVDSEITISDTNRSVSDYNLENGKVVKRHLTDDSEIVKRSKVCLSDTQHNYGEKGGKNFDELVNTLDSISAFQSAPSILDAFKDCRNLDDISAIVSVEDISPDSIGPLGPSTIIPDINMNENAGMAVSNSHTVEECFEIISAMKTGEDDFEINHLLSMVKQINQSNPKK